MHLSWLDACNINDSWPAKMQMCSVCTWPIVYISCCVTLWWSVLLYSPLLWPHWFFLFTGIMTVHSVWRVRTVTAATGEVPPATGRDGRIPQKPLRKNPPSWMRSLHLPRMMMKNGQFCALIDFVPMRSILSIPISLSEDAVVRHMSQCLTPQMLRKSLVVPKLSLRTCTLGIRTQM